MTAPAPPAILFVDDEPLSCRWFERAFSSEFAILTAPGVEEALQLLRERGAQIGVLVTDHRMPGRDGIELLQAAQRDHAHVVRLMVTAYAEKDVAIAAINQGQVFRILEKPMDMQLTRATLHEAMALHLAQARERTLNESRAAAMRETLGFLAHELNTPLTTVRGYMAALKDRYRGQEGPRALPEGQEPGVHVAFEEGTPGEVIAAIAAAESRAMYCQSLVATFVQSARDAYPGAEPLAVTAASLVEALLNEYPFDDDERSWVASRVVDDFLLPGRRDLLYLVMCTLAKNALQALRGRAAPRLFVELGRDAPGPGATNWMRFSDNGPGIAPEILPRLTHEPLTTRAQSGGSGMGLLFCRRVVQSLGGGIDIESQLGAGTAVTLRFPPFRSEPRGRAGA